MNIPANIILLVTAAVDDGTCSRSDAFDYFKRMLSGIDFYEPPSDRPDELAALNEEIIARFNPPETVADLLADLNGPNPTRANCAQAATVIRQLLDKRSPRDVPLQVEDR